ncbi:MAG TPA: rod shape-determining protein [Candidatus Pullichristensenella excrementipullorum]|nr:rod shape-determining protein [Candidatus Pullichristensenella excrementipullorum]
MKTQVAAIEFGTSKIVTLIAQSGSVNRCDIIGSGTVPYDGFAQGDWNTPEQLARVARDSIAAAELEANSKVREIYIGVPGEFTHVCTGEAEITLENAGEITEDDVNRVQDAVADQLKIAELGGYVMHRSPAWFIVDDGKKTMMPMGVHGERLRAQVSFLVAEPVFIEDMKELMGSLGVTILGFLSPTLGMSLLLLSIEDRDRVAMLVDVGYLNSEISVIEGDAITYHAMLPLGGGQITADLCEELRVPMRAAEQIKRRYVFDPDEFDQDAYTEVAGANGERLSFPREYVKRPVEKSMDELCDMIDLTLKNDAAGLMGPRSQVFLTGGGIALMRGGREYLATKIGRPVKVPVAKTAKMNSPVYASALGLVDLIFDSIEQQSPKETSGIKKLRSLFKG